MFSSFYMSAETPPKPKNSNQNDKFNNLAIVIKDFWYFDSDSVLLGNHWLCVFSELAATGAEAGEGGVRRDEKWDNREEAAEK